jgi:hypothetical protein
VPNLQITAAGRKRVASDDFAKILVHVIAQAAETGIPEEFVLTYVALNLTVDETNVVELPAEREGALLADFVNANEKEIRATLQQVLVSPAYLAHALECFGTEALDEYLATLPSGRA